MAKKKTPTKFSDVANEVHRIVGACFEPKMIPRLKYKDTAVNEFRSRSMFVSWRKKGRKFDVEIQVSERCKEISATVIVNITYPGDIKVWQQVSIPKLIGDPEACLADKIVQIITLAQHMLSPADI